MPIYEISQYRGAASPLLTLLVFSLCEFWDYLKIDGAVCSTRMRICRRSQRRHVSPRQEIHAAMTRFKTLEAKSVLAQAEMWTDTHPPTLLTPAEVWNMALLSTCNLESYKDLAGIRGVSDRTIAAQMRSARLKLEARTNLFAVAEALRRQLIPSFERWEPGLSQAQIIPFPRDRAQAHKA